MNNDERSEDDSKIEDADARPTPDESETKPKGRSLWAVMGQPKEAEDSTTASSSEESKSDDGTADSAVAQPADDEPKKGLWAVMGGDVQTEPEPAKPAKATWSVVTETTDSDGGADEDIDQSSNAQTIDDTEEAAPRKGLWSVMQPAATGDSSRNEDDESEEIEDDQQDDEGDSIQDEAAEDEPESSNEDDNEEEESAPQDVRLKSAAGVFESRWRTPYSEPEEGDSDSSDADYDEDEDDDQEGYQQPSYDPVTEQPVELAVGQGDTEPDALRRVRSRPVGQSRKHIFSVCLGVLALLLSALSLWPAVWSSIPSSVAAIGAMLLGMMSISELRRAKEPATMMTMPAIGILMGTVGMFLAPTVIASIGKEWKDAYELGETKSRLQLIGESFDEFHGQLGRYPSSGSFLLEPGADASIHSWMTQMLPYMGYDTLSQSIDQSATYDDPVNATAMQTIVPEFLTIGIERRQTGRGHAVAHYAGVGGELITEESGLVQLGIFSKNKHVRQRDVVDGLSQTLVVGEIADSFPAWGEPENFRTIGRGLNRDLQGFGNAKRDGAVFLLGDGSVRFFSNKTSPRVLEQLSSRNGSDFVPSEIIGSD